MSPKTSVTAAATPDRTLSMGAFLRVRARRDGRTRSRTRPDSTRRPRRKRSEPLAPGRASGAPYERKSSVRPTVAGQRRIRTGFPHVGAWAAADELTTDAETSSKRPTPVIWQIVSHPPGGPPSGGPAPAGG